MSHVPTFSLILRGGDQAASERLRPHAAGAELLLASEFERGLEAADGDVLVYLRAECQPLPGWMARLREAFADPSVAAAAGRVFPALAPTASDWARVVAHENFGPFERFDLGHFDRKVRPQERSFQPTDNLAIRRSALLWKAPPGAELPSLRPLLEKEKTVLYLPSAAVRRPIPADFPLEERFASCWQEYGRRQVRMAAPSAGLARLKERWKARRKSARYRRRMADWPELSSAWTTLAAKHHLHLGRALELAD